MCPYSLDLPGGVATHVLGLVAWLNGHGHDAWVIAPGTRPCAVPSVLVGGAVPLAFNGSTARLALRPRQVRAAIDAAAQADVVHVHEPLTPGIAYGVARAYSRLVVTHHASYRPGRLVPLLRQLSGRLPVDRISLAVSPAAAQTAAAATGVIARVVPNAIRLPAAPAARRPRRPRVLFLGRLDEPRKGYRHFVELSRQGLDADFVAIGPGGRGTASVRELGVLSDAERDRELGHASIVVAPNRYGESFGMVLVEALAAGAAVVASDLPAFRAVAGETPAATFVPVDDVAALTAAVRSRLSTPIDPAVAWAAAKPFAWDQVAPEIVNAYGQLLGTR